jgi:hypothetical protein
MPDQRKFLTFGPRVAIIVVGNEGNDESTLMGRSGKSAVESGASRPKSNRVLMGHTAPLALGMGRGQRKFLTSLARIDIIVVEIEER